MGKTEKPQKENHATKVTKIPKTKQRKYWMNEALNTNFLRHLDIQTFKTSHTFCSNSFVGSFFSSSPTLPKAVS